MWGMFTRGTGYWPTAILIHWNQYTSYHWWSFGTQYASYLWFLSCLGTLFILDIQLQSLRIEWLSFSTTREVDSATISNNTRATTGMPRPKLRPRIGGDFTAMTGELHMKSSWCAALMCSCRCVNRRKLHCVMRIRASSKDVLHQGNL